MLKKSGYIYLICCPDDDCYTSLYFDFDEPHLLEDDMYDAIGLEIVYDTYNKCMSIAREILGRDPSEEFKCGRGYEKVNVSFGESYEETKDQEESKNSYDDLGRLVTDQELFVPDMKSII